MDYQYKYQKYLQKNSLVLVEMTGGTQKKCTIDPTDKIYYGSGGSLSIIVITKDKRVYKMMPIFYPLDMLPDEIEWVIKQNKKSFKSEIGIAKTLTETIVNTGISPHYVKLISNYDCPNTLNLFKSCGSHTSFLKTRKKDEKCTRYFNDYPLTRVYPTYTIAQLEWCPQSCSDYIVSISKLKTPQLKEALDILLFQICYTLHVTQQKYPYFIHNDLFVRNVLGMAMTITKTKTNKQNNNTYNRYTTNNITYDVPHGGYIPKITDFGYSNLNEKFHSRHLLKSPHKDLFTFAYDIYNGQNLGSTSLTSLFKSKFKRIKFLNHYFSSFFDTAKLSRIPDHPRYIAGNWSIALDPEFCKSFGLKSPSDMLTTYFNKIFQPNDDHVVDQEYSTK